MARKKAPKAAPSREGISDLAPERVIVLLGDNTYARRSLIGELGGRLGKRVVRVSSGDDASLAALRVGEGACWVVEGAGAAALGDIAAQAAASSVLLVLDSEGDPPEGSDLEALVEHVGPARVRAFRRPPPWEEVPEAVAFVKSEMEKHGFGVGPGVAEVLVEGSAGDYGYLAFEVLKLTYLARARGLTYATSDMARASAGGPLGPDLDRVSQALGDGGIQALALALAQVRGAQRADPTPRVVAMLDRVVGQWLAAALARDPDPDRAARRLGVHPFAYRVRIAGPVRRWKESGALRIMSVLAAADAAVRGGAANPWAVLCSGLFSACLDLGWGRL